MDRDFLIALLFAAGLGAGTTAMAGDAGTAPVPEKTGKERLSDKASDEQRVDDCNVPPEHRGAGTRPTGCGQRRQPAKTGSESANSPN